MKLTQQNYYGHEADKLMSNSQSKVWLKCPAQAHARFVAHSWTPSLSKDFAIGSLVDSLLTEPESVQNTLERFDIFLTKDNTKSAIAKGGPDRIPNSTAKIAYDMAGKAKQNAAFMQILNRSECQKQYEFELGGMLWKCRLDLLDREIKYVWDYKTTADISGEKYVERIRARGNFIAQFNYSRQLAIYREAARQNEDEEYKVGIIGHSKKDTRDLRIMPWDEICYRQIDDALEIALGEIEHLKELRDTPPEELHRCENCDYCIETRNHCVFPYSDPE